MEKGEAPWDNERIVAFLKKLPDSEPFIPAAVTALGKNGAELLLANNETMTLSSNAMRWAGRSPLKWANKFGFVNVITVNGF